MPTKCFTEFLWIGADVIAGREVSDMFLLACLHAGLSISGKEPVTFLLCPLFYVISYFTERCPGAHCIDFSFLKSYGSLLACTTIFKLN